MDLSTVLQNQILGTARKELSPYSAILPSAATKSLGGGLMASYSASASSSASSGPSKSGDISGGTAFNIGGINFGTQNQPVAASSSPVAGLGSSAIASLSGLTVPLILLGGALLLFVILKRK